MDLSPLKWVLRGCLFWVTFVSSKGNNGILWLELRLVLWRIKLFGLWLSVYLYSLWSEPKTIQVKWVRGKSTQIKCLFIITVVTQEKNTRVPPGSNKNYLSPVYLLCEMRLLFWTSRCTIYNVVVKCCHQARTVCQSKSSDSFRLPVNKYYAIVLVS